MKSVLILVVSAVMACTVALGGAGSVRAAEGGNVEKCGGGEIFLDAKEKEVFDLHNRVRKKHDLPTFCVDPKLTDAAEFHSGEMIENDYFAHESSYDGRRYYEDFAQRIKRFDYRYRTAGENIAWGTGGYAEPSSIMKSWMRSPDHRRNILNRKFREIGIGVVEGDYKGNSNAAVYTADFGTKL